MLQTHTDKNQGEILGMIRSINQVYLNKNKKLSIKYIKYSN